MSTAAILQLRPPRLSTALVLSLLVHTLLLSISLGGQTFGVGMNFPWQERRLGPDGLRVSLAPVPPVAQVAAPAAPAQEAFNKSTLPAVDEPISAPTAAPLTTPPSAIKGSEVATVFSPPQASEPAPAPAAAWPSAPPPSIAKRPDVNLPIAPNAPPIRARADVETEKNPVQASELPVPITTVDATKIEAAEASREAALEQRRIVLEKQSAERLRRAEATALAQREAARQAELQQEVTRAEQTAKSEAARMAAERQELARQETLRQETLRQAQAKKDEKEQQDAVRQAQDRVEAARRDAAGREAARQELARLAALEAARQAELEVARQEAAKQAAARQDAAKQEAARQELARQEATRQEAAQQEAAQQEAAKQAAARQAAMKQEAARQEVAKQAAAKQAAATQEAGRQEAAKQAAAEQDRAKQALALRERLEQEAQREERLRAIGKQLNAEAAKREAASTAPSRSLLPGISGLRRGWLLGRGDPNRDLVLYAEAMSRKIELNMTFDMVREAVKQPHAQPVVTVAIRADGSVEKITFEVSSGVPAIDETIRNVVASQAPYAKFSPTLTSQYDVIEIRRTWTFDMAIRLQ